MPSITLGCVLKGSNGEAIRVEKFIKHGGFGEVYRAVGIDSGSSFAVKTLLTGRLPTDGPQKALMNEMRLARQIKHPNVVDLLFVNDDPSSEFGPYLVSEYISGGTLEDELRQRKQSKTSIPLDAAITMMCQISEGLRAINEKIIHRDIKPDNISIDGSTLKIGDFGIAKLVAESTRLETFKGCQHLFYMAPEGWTNETNTPKLDVYSAGLVFYQILTLEHPLRASVLDPLDDIQWREAHLFTVCPDVRKSRGETPLSLSQLLSRMVGKHPDKRPNWDEVIEILNKPDFVTPEIRRPHISEAVALVHKKQLEVQKQNLMRMKQAEDRQQTLDFYKFSCRELLDSVKPIADDFNEHCQHGKIMWHTISGSTTFNIPMSGRIEITFFAPQISPLKLKIGELIGGGWIGIVDGRSANLLLLKQHADDPYGQWVIYEISRSGFLSGEALERLGLGVYDSDFPFGFRDRHFYEHIQHVQAGAHIFNYTGCGDVVPYFEKMLLDALQSEA